MKIKVTFEVVTWFTWMVGERSHTDQSSDSKVTYIISAVRCLCRLGCCGWPEQRSGVWRHHRGRGVAGQTGHVLRQGGRPSLRRHQQQGKNMRLSDVFLPFLCTLYTTAVFVLATTEMKCGRPCIRLFILRLMGIVFGIEKILYRYRSIFWSKHRSIYTIFLLLLLISDYTLICTWN